MLYGASAAHSIAGLAMRLSSALKFGALLLTEKASATQIGASSLVPAHYALWVLCCMALSGWRSSADLSVPEGLTQKQSSCYSRLDILLDIKHSYKQASKSRSIHRQFAFGGDGRVIEKHQELQHFPFGSGAEEG